MSLLLVFFFNKTNGKVCERTKPAPFAIVAPFAKQACELVKYDCHFPLLSLSPVLEITGSKNRTNSSLQPQADDNIRTNCSLCYNAPTAQGHTTATPPPFFHPKPPPLKDGISIHITPLTTLGE